MPRVAHGPMYMPMHVQVDVVVSCLASRTGGIEDSWKVGMGKGMRMCMCMCMFMSMFMSMCVCVRMHMHMHMHVRIRRR